MRNEIHRVGRHAAYEPSRIKRRRDGPDAGLGRNDIYAPYGPLAEERAGTGDWEEDAENAEYAEDELSLFAEEPPSQAPPPATRPRARTGVNERTRGKQKPKERDAAGNAQSGAVALLQELVFLLIKILVIVVAFVMLFTFLFGILRYEDPAMSPAVKDGDLVIYYRIDKTYAASDTLVLEYQNRPQVRRVIATAGDVVNITEDGLFINGALQQESAIYEKTQRFDTGVEFPLTVGEGEVFVLGDSRESATDSRVYGAVKIDDTLGKVMTIIRRRGI